MHSPLEEVVQQYGCAPAALVATQRRQPQLDRHAGDDLQIGGQAGAVPAQIAGHQRSQASFEKGAGANRGLLQNLSGAFPVKAAEIHPSPGCGCQIAGVVEKIETVKRTGIHAQENAHARPGPLGDREEQRGQLVESGSAGTGVVRSENGLQVVENEQGSRV